MDVEESDGESSSQRGIAASLVSTHRKSCYHASKSPVKAALKCVLG
jgi:hypothetical protein